MEHSEFVTRSEISSLEKLINSKFEHLEKTTELSRMAMEKRLDNLNQIREALRDQGTLAFTRAEHQLFKDSIDKEIGGLRESRAELAGKANQSSVNITLMVAILGLAISCANIMRFFLAGVR